MQFAIATRSWLRVIAVLAAASLWTLTSIACAQAQPAAKTDSAKPAPANAKADAKPDSKANATDSPAKSDAPQAVPPKNAPANEAPLEDAAPPATPPAAPRVAADTEPGAQLAVAPATPGQTTPEVAALLERITKAHGDIKTLTAAFDQVKVWKEAGDVVKSSGKVYLQMPDRLRWDLEGSASDPKEKIDPEELLFVGKKFYQYVPSLPQVDTYSYDTDEEAQEHFRMLLLGFGVSGDQVLSSYNVTQEPADPKMPATTVLAFVPVHPEIAKVVRRIVVWFDSEKFLPRKVEVEEVDGDVTTVTIRSGEPKINPSIPEKTFLPDWPTTLKGHKVNVINH